MNEVYKSLKSKVQESIQRRKDNSTMLPETLDFSVSANEQMDELEVLIADRLCRLKATVNNESLTAANARQAEQLVEGLTGRVAELEAKLRETEETLQRKNLACQKTDENFSRELHNLESDLKKKNAALVERDMQLNDLRSQVKLLTQGIGRMSSIFRQAEVLAGMNDEVSTDAAAPLDGQETRIASDAPREIVQPAIIDQIAGEFARVARLMIPRALVFVRERVAHLGESMETFPKSRLPELLDSLAREIPDPHLQADFRQRFPDNTKIH